MAKLRAVRSNVESARPTPTTSLDALETIAKEGP